MNAEDTPPCHCEECVSTTSQSYVLGFTLAEVLLTIGILGVVAAMTIPTLMQNSLKKELVSHYLKMNNRLSHALKN
ncbi:type II secretion system protein, partial [bacterium]|nr:type II secretion system protein [bacterium]